MKAAIAQQSHYTEDHARQAEGVLRGIFFDYSKEKAVTILHEIAEQHTLCNECTRPDIPQRYRREEELHRSDRLNRKM